MSLATKLYIAYWLVNAAIYIGMAGRPRDYWPEGWTLVGILSVSAGINLAFLSAGVQL